MTTETIFRIAFLVLLAALFASFVPFIIVRARREEAALADEFGEEWQEYCRCVPAFFPRLW